MTVIKNNDCFGRNLMEIHIQHFEYRKNHYDLHNFYSPEMLRSIYMRFIVKKYHSVFFKKFFSVAMETIRLLSRCAMHVVKIFFCYVVAEEKSSLGSFILSDFHEFGDNNL